MRQRNLLYVLPLVILSLLTAICSGWIRIGWSIPVSSAAGYHGALMVNSFLASLIFLERAVTFRQRWILLLPIFNAASVIGFVAGFPQISLLFLNIGSAGFVVMCTYFLLNYKELHYAAFLAGAICLQIGNILLLSRDSYSLVVPWWMGFLLLTIVAERLELSRFLKLTTLKRGLLLALLLLVLTGLLWSGQAGSIIVAIALIGVAVWLLRYDMARQAVRIQGQHRYSAVLLLTGYAWLIVTAIFMITQSSFRFGYDATIHSFFIGFVFSMIFSHAPIILPAVAKLPIKIYRPVLYIWFGLLQGSLLLRLAGDVAGNAGIRKIGGGLNGIVILCFFVTVALTARKEMGKRRQLLRKT